MPRWIFTEGKHTAFELMMQEVPRGFNPSVESEEQKETHVHSKNEYAWINKEMGKNDYVCMSNKSDKVL
jgi:hypothetical protein